MIRFTRDRVCPICNGFEAAPRGHGVRCAGFQDSANPNLIHCCSDAHAGNLPLDMRTDPASYLHRLGDDCDCGLSHATYAPRIADRRSNRSDLGPVIARYVYNDEDGQPVVSVTRHEPKDFRPWHWSGSEWIMGLGCKRTPCQVCVNGGADPILYNLPAIAAAPVTKVVHLCYAPDTQVLTPSGWIAFPDLGDEQVAQFDAETSEIDFITPLAHQQFSFDGELVHQRADWSDLLVTPDHRSLVHHARCQRKVIRAEEVVAQHLIPVSGMRLTSGGPTPDEARLLAAWQGDGVKHFSKYRVAWNLKKPRKVERIKLLLDRLEIPWKEAHYPSTLAWSTITVDHRDAPILDLLSDKRFGWEILDWSVSAREALIDELAYWDGDSVSDVAIRFFTADKQSADVIAAVAVTTGWGVITRCDSRRGSLNYVINLKKTFERKLGHRPQRVPYTGPVYCLTVPSGFIVTRRNGKTTISGNCEGEKAANRLINMGLLATTYPGGAGKMSRRAAEALSERPVAIYPDNDRAGRLGSHKVAAVVAAVGATAKVVELPDLPEKGGVDDWLDNGGTLDALKQIVQATPMFGRSHRSTEIIASNGQLPTNGRTSFPLHEIDNPSTESLPELPEFPVNALPEALRDIAEEAEEHGLAPAGYVATFGLTVLSTAVGGLWDVVINDSWRERPIIWTGVCTYSGLGKSPALKVAFAPLKEIERDWKAEYKSDLESWKQQPKDERDPQPVPQRLIVDDITMERQIVLLSENPHGLCLRVDELRGAITQLGQYKGGRGSDRQRFLSLWDGESISYDRIKDAQHVSVDRPALNIAGGIQPDVVDTILDDDDGLSGRFLIWRADEQQMIEKTVDGISVETQTRWRALIRTLILGDLRPTMVRPIRMSEEARAYHNEHDNAYRRIAINHHGYISFLANKCGGLMARLALIFYACRLALGQRPGDEVGINDVMNAQEVVDVYLSHAMGRPPRHVNLLATPAERSHDEGVHRLTMWLARREEAVTTTRDILMAHVAGIRTKEDAKRLIERYEATYPGRVARMEYHGQPRIEILAP